MANLATFYMRIRGTRENIESFMWKIPADTEVDEKHGTKKDSMYYISGDCNNSMGYSFFDDSDTSLEKCAAECNIEFEAFCTDFGQPDWFEHYHYKGSECLANLYLQQVWQIDPDELDEDVELPSPETLEKYYENPQPGLYVLKDEFQKICGYDYETGEFDCDFTMSFDDLK